MKITNVYSLRDPFMLVDNGVYYLYGTGVDGSDWDNTIWACYVNDSGSLDGEWKKTEHLVYQRPDGAERQFWAPEVHKYNGNYYMLASYFSSKTGHRGSSILKSASPLGPFKEISDGHVTPHDRDSIDATLYVDNDGTPWLVFVDEWTCTDDGIGRMDVAKLSDDLTHIVIEPKEIFRADTPNWTDHRVTDGCFLHTTRGGKLLMIWSNFDNDQNYCVGIAHAKDGTPDGEWVHESTPLFERGITDHHDGGHGMIFENTDGQLYLCLHSPNLPCDECNERTVLIPIKEVDGTIKICG